jgi:hypothetical protein
MSKLSVISLAPVDVGPAMSSAETSSARAGIVVRHGISSRHPISVKRHGLAGKHQFKMPKALTEIRSLARSHTRTALNVLVGVMRNTKAAAPARIAAANSILDRGWGKATQAIENGDDGALELIHRIERVIVHPENPDSQNL